MNIDYIIVGQGLAGTMLAYKLQQAQQKVIIIDNAQENAATHIAAGIINPITGRNFVKTWLADEAIPYAIQTYKDLAHLLKEDFYIPHPITWILDSNKMWNDWQEVSAKETVKNYIQEISDNSLYTENLQDAIGAVILNNSGRVNISKLALCFRKYLQAQDLYRQEDFDYTQLNTESTSGIIYKDIQAKGIIFCQGAKARLEENPFWCYLPFWTAKGEILIVKIPNSPFQKQLIKHKGLLIAPLENDLYWVGASYLRNYQQEEITQEEKENLQKELASILTIPFEIIDHKAGIRPTVRDRKPFLGQHPQHNNIFIFNGLGAKGAYMAPYFADKMTDFLVHNMPLEKEINVQRIKNI